MFFLKASICKIINTFSENQPFIKSASDLSSHQYAYNERYFRIYKTSWFITFYIESSSKIVFITIRRYSKEVSVVYLSHFLIILTITYHVLK